MNLQREKNLVALTLLLGRPEIIESVAQTGKLHK